MGIMQYFLNQAGIFIKDFICIKPSNAENGLTEEKLTVSLSTNNFHKYPVPTFISSPDSIEQARSEVYDGVFVVKDNSFTDEKNEIINGVKTMIRCAQKNNSGRNISMILSKNDGYTASKLAPDNAIVIDAEGVELDCTAEKLESITDEMTALVYQKAFSDPMKTQTFFTQNASMFRKELSREVSGSSLDTLTSMLTIEAFLDNFIGIKRLNTDLLLYYNKTINNKGEMVMNANTSIKTEFNAKLCEKFRSKVFTAVKKMRNLRFDNDGKAGVISGDRLLISSSMIDNVVKEMPGIKISESVINAFRTDGDLICTDGNTHPFDSHDSTGKYQRLYFYDLPADILDEDVLYMLQNPEKTAFLLT